MEKSPGTGSRMLVVEAGTQGGQEEGETRWAAGCGPAGWSQLGEATSLNAVASPAQDLELSL